MKPIHKLAIANRGEVAVRIIHAAKELGIPTVLLHSDSDIKTLAFRLADEKVCIGPSPVNQSYLDIDANINGAKSCGADAIHPGFGFLSENASFAQRCKEEGINFVGPSPKAIDLFGDKVKAKDLVQSIGEPLIPGFEGEDQNVEFLVREANKIGFPLVAKAAAGGGGRGLKVILEASLAKPSIESAQREGKSAFGDGRVFLEKYLDRAKHIEVQIFVDASGKVYHLGERECSVQRRHQKVIEEAPSELLSGELRTKILQSAVNIAKAGKYKGAGTVEFLVQDGAHYFLEMNTRLQVEHPVTELVLGIDLVKAQIMTAQDMGLTWDQEDLVPRGHAIECRLYAEDAFSNGMPSTGELLGTFWPTGPGRRFDFGVEAGDEVTPFYDSMIAKIIVWDETRTRAIEKMKLTLSETVVFGVKTNIPYLQAILNHPDFVEGSMTTRFIESHFPQGLIADKGVDNKELEEQLKILVSSSAESSVSVFGNESSISPWINDHWGTK